MPPTDSAAPYGEWRRRMQELAESMYAAAEDARLNGRVSPEERARMIAEFNRSAGGSHR